MGVAVLVVGVSAVPMSVLGGEWRARSMQSRARQGYAMSGLNGPAPQPRTRLMLVWNHCIGEQAGR
jgi:hypothetical protein